MIIITDDRVSIPVSLPKGFVKEIDELVRKKEFSSRSDAIRFGVRLLVTLEKRTHQRAEDYAFEEIIDGIERGKNVHRH